MKWIRPSIERKDEHLLSFSLDNGARCEVQMRRRASQHCYRCDNRLLSQIKRARYRPGHIAHTCSQQ